MTTIGNPEGFLEEGFADFAGETSQLIELSAGGPRKPAAINLSVHESENTSATPNTETDIPARNVGNIQVSSYWHASNDRKFYIVTSAEFYGRIYYSVQS